MPELFGIENLKRLVRLGCAIPKQIAISSEDGWQIYDIAAFFDEVADLIGVVRNIKAITDEWKDLSEDERLDLFSYVKQEFDIADDKVEEFVEDALVWAASTLSLISRFKSLKD